MITKGNNKRSNLISVILTNIIFIASSSLYAATWENQFTLPLAYEYQTNPTLSSTDEQSISKLVVSPAYSLNVSQDLNTWNANLSYKLERSSKAESSQDREYPSVNLGWNRALESGQMGVTAHYDDNSTRVTEFDDSGQVLVDGSRKLASISANWSHTINEKASIAINAGYSQAKYSNIGLIDYSTTSLGASINYKLNSKIEPFISFNSSKTDNEDAIEATDVQSLTIGTLYSATEKLNFTVSGSVNNVKTTTEKTTNSASFTMNYGTEYTQSSILLLRSLAASGSTGSVVESTQLNASWSYSVTEISSLAVNIGARENKNTNKTLTYRINYTDKLSESWDWRLSVEHRNLSRLGAADVSNNIVGLTLILKTN